MKKTLAVAFLLALWSFPAWSQDTGVYLGASIGQADYRDACGDVNVSGCDKTDTSWRVFAGYHFSRYFAAELGYADLGGPKLNGVATFPSGSSAPVSASTDVTAWDLSAIGSFPVTDRLSAYGRGGIYRAEVDASGTVTINGVPSGTSSFSGSNTGAIFGIGLKYQFLRGLAVRAEWHRYFEVKGDGADVDIDVLSVGLLYRF